MKDRANDDMVVNAIYHDDLKAEMVAEDATIVQGKVMTQDAEKWILHVQDLSYKPPRRLVKGTFEYLRTTMTKYQLSWLIPPAIKQINSQGFQDTPLRRINFSAKGGELTAIIGSNNERRELINLLTGRMSDGEFDGDILLTGPNINKASYYYDNIAFVQRKPLYIPGITYHDMLHYSVQLKLQSHALPTTNNLTISQFIDNRTNELLELMNLTHCKDRVIPTYPELRGELGCELRRLSIALEIVDLPPVMIIDEPTLSFDPAMSMSILQCLHTLASRGHIVVCSMTKPFSQELSLLDRIVLLSEGYTIFANSPSKLQEYFCSREMGYDFRKGTDLVEFVLDIASGIERPITQRLADLPSILQEKFEMSDYYETIQLPYNKQEIIDDSGNMITVTNKELLNTCTAFTPEFFFLYGYGSRLNSSNWWLASKRILTVTKRAIHTKLTDFDANRQQMNVCLLIGIVCGYLQLGQGSTGHYCLSMLNFPYATTANLSSLLFITVTVCWALPWLNVHVACQKLQVYRYEQKSGCCTPFAFAFATLISEVPTALFFISIFLNIVYWMVELSKGIDNYIFFMIVGYMQCICGLLGIYLFSAIAKKEILTRNIFFVIITFVALLSGFSFQLPKMTDYFQNVAKLNPVRWAFEACMNWKFLQYRDGDTWLVGYGQNTFHHKEVYRILGNIMIVNGILCFLVLQKGPILLRRKEKKMSGNESSNNGHSFSRDSVNSVNSEGANLPVDELSLSRKNTRQSEAIKPVLFMRDSSVTGKNYKLSINVSKVGDDMTDRGPTVMFKDLSYRVKDNRDPTGYKMVLNRVTGQFDWGKLSMIMGATGSGKTSLLHILSGDTAIGAEVTGKVVFNNKPVSTSQPLWQRCGFVGMENELHRDLTVRQILTYAMKLRCLNSSGYAVLNDNIQRTVEILHLEDVLDKKAKKLNSGEWKRLCIAEEMVHGPKLLLMDEPTTGISLVETSILLMCFREMVNQDRTVVATIHQPNADVFKLFDTLMLLSQGRVIYHGNASKAAAFFTSSPFQFQMTGYTNPADFIADIANLSIADSKGEFVDPSLLENYYMQGEFYNKLRLRFKPDPVASTNNPLIKPAPGSNDLEKGNISIQSTHEVAMTSCDVDPNDTGTAGKTTVSRPAPIPLIAIGLLLQDLFTCNNNGSIFNALRITGLLCERSFYALYNRYELVLSSILLHVILACMFGWLMGDSSDISALYNVVSFLAVGSMFLIFTNILFAFYMYNNHQVFLKEYSRGLYSNTIRWISSDYALYLLRGANGIIFCIVVWGMANLSTDEDIFGFACLSFMMFMMICAVFAECIIFMVPDLISAYISISALAFTNFMFSGLFVKFQTLPNWMSYWVPSLSMIRWNLQGNMINLYNNAFPTASNGFSIYTLLLRLFGYGGKTKWFCLQCLIIVFCVYKGVSLFIGGISAIFRKGGRRLATPGM